MAGTIRYKKKLSGADTLKTQGLSRTPDDIWLQNPEIIRRFLEVRRDYEHLCAEVEYILRKKIADQGIETSSITSRAKTLNSFLDKLQRKHYDDPFEQVTDLAGTRVVCLYHSDIAKVAKIIHTEFVVAEDKDKIDELGANKFGYGARHFIVRLGKSSSGARYDDLKKFACEVQVRTVVQDAWAIIQHHMVYKRESQMPTHLQRKLNSLAGLFETVDDSFERIREEREAYLKKVRDSADKPVTFLKNEFNLDSFKEYLKWSYPNRAIESWDGQARKVFDGIVNAGYKTLRDVDSIVKKTAAIRDDIIKEFGDNIIKAADGTIPSSIEPAIALSLWEPDGESLLSWDPLKAKIIKKYRMSLKRR
jgi:ppGpp synthetase/RelA/SpoT-type nucleotidyltranferase